MDWTVRPAGAADAGALSLIASATFLETYAGILAGADIVAHCSEHFLPAAFALRIAAADTVVTVAEHGHAGAPIGYAVSGSSGLPFACATDVELRRLYVLAAWHGSGLGAALMAGVVDRARRLGCRRMLLGVYHGNARARRFYEKQGFVVVGERPFQVGDAVHHDPVYALTL